MGTQLTVVDVCRELGVEPTPSLTWSVGNLLRRQWQATYGELPPKALRPKTCGRGSHCFAVYPARWRARIVDAIQRHATQRSPQGELFA